MLETGRHVRAEVGRRIVGPVSGLREHVPVRDVPRAQEVHAFVEPAERREREREGNAEHARDHDEREMRSAVPRREDCEPGAFRGERVP